jgi:hypothetical protein
VGDDDTCKCKMRVGTFGVVEGGELGNSSDQGALVARNDRWWARLGLGTIEGLTRYYLLSRAGLAIKKRIREPYVRGHSEVSGMIGLQHVAVGDSELVGSRHGTDGRRSSDNAARPKSLGE